MQKDFKVFAVSWNLGGAKIHDNHDLSKDLFDFDEEDSPDIVVVAMQEFITVSAINVLNSGSDTSLKNLDQSILSSLNKEKQTFVNVKNKDLLGLALLVYIKDSFKDHVSKVNYDTVKQSVMGIETLANKGAVIIKMNVFLTSFCFINLQFSPSEKNLNAKVQGLRQIHEKAF